jgi:Ni2+-binding GTPase involved in maturation of urease and hydrogenase
MIEPVRQSVSLINPEARIIGLSAKRGDGVVEIVKSIQEIKAKT